MSLRVQPATPLSNDAAADAALILDAIRKGHLYTVVDGVAAPPYFTFTGSNATGTATAGDVLAVADGVALRVQSNAPAGWTTVVHDGAATLAAAADTQDFTVHGPKRRTEHDPNSVGAVEVASTANGLPELRHRFGLAGGDAVGQVTALVRDVPNGVAGFDRLTLSIRAERPMRISVQVRDTTADRWQRSIYIDASTQERTITIDELIPVGVTHVAAPARDAIRAVMFVIDTTNTKPGTAGRIWFQRADLEQIRTKN
jgi:hypothetical protein